MISTIFWLIYIEKKLKGKMEEEENSEFSSVSFKEEGSDLKNKFKKLGKIKEGIKEDI